MLPSLRMVSHTHRARITLSCADLYSLDSVDGLDLSEDLIESILGLHQRGLFGISAPFAAPLPSDGVEARTTGQSSSNETEGSHWCISTWSTPSQGCKKRGLCTPTNTTKVFVGWHHLTFGVISIILLRLLGFGVYRSCGSREGTTVETSGQIDNFVFAPRVSF